MRRVVSIKAARGNAADGAEAAGVSNNTPRRSSARANAAKGSAPGRQTAMRHALPASAMSPRYSAGRRPQLINEDLPLPELPSTARKRRLPSRSTMASTAASRPK